MIDTHCHLYDEAFDTDRADAVRRALDAGVSHMILPAIDSQSHLRQEALAQTYSGCFRQMMGLHPTSVDVDPQSELDTVRDKLFATTPSPYVAVGEVGLDLYWDKSYLEQQLHSLKIQFEWARQLQLPVCLHVRKAHNELFALLRDLNYPVYHGVMHCFGGSLQEAHRAIEMGFHIGIGGVVTFKNATLAEVAREIPLERILLETDSPYLAPVPFRGRRNESSYIPLIAAKIADIKGVTLQKVDEVTTYAARQLFAL